MSFNDKLYNELLDQGINEALACNLANMKIPEKKKKPVFFKEKEIFDIQVHYICTTCKSERTVKRVSSKPEDIFSTLRICSNCAEFLLERLSHKQLVTLATLENHPEETLAKLTLLSKIKLGDRKTALEWLHTSIPTTSNIPDDKEEKEIKVKEVVKIDKEKALKSLIASGVNKELAELMLNTAEPEKKKRKVKLISKQDIVITQTCTTCHTKVSFKKNIETLAKEDLYQSCSIRLCHNCLKMFDNMTSEQLVTFILVQNSRYVDIRVLPTAKQLELASQITSSEAYNLHI